MLKELSNFDDEISLICNSGIQFLDFGFSIEDNTRFSRFFFEKELNGEVSDLSQKGYQLIALEQDVETGDYIECGTNRICHETSIYSVNFKDTLEAYNNVWLPVPFFQLRDIHASGAKRFAEGPVNWVRMRVIRLDEPDSLGNTHRLVLAIDTRPEKKIPHRPYTSPDWQDIESEVRYSLAAHPLHHFWFLAEKWVANWLMADFEQAMQERRIRLPMREDEQEAVCANWAYFSVLLEGLQKFCNIPNLFFLDTISESSPYNSIDVDIVLDIGNSRTCGVLIETNTQDGLDLSDSASLELRDLGKPQHVYSEPFHSQVEFSKPDFGKQRFSKMAGNTRGFLWPSLLRVGNEALRLNGKSDGTDGDTGLSAPKRYLLDTREARQMWYFNSTERHKDSSIDASKSPVEGDIMAYITSGGDLLATADDDAMPAFQPKFSRASLFTFMLMEIVLQAFQQVNSPALRAKRQTPKAPRILRKVIMTVPSATPLVELKAFRDRAQAALDLLWEAMEWASDDAGKVAPPKPELLISYDEASCTQIVYLYAEIARKFRRNAVEYFETFGKVHTEGSKPVIRIASLDIGGGTTDLMISTYHVRDSGGALIVKQNFREGFRCAGDDILEAIVAQHVVPQIEAALKEAGLPDPEGFMYAFNSNAGKDAPSRHLRKLFVTQALVPVAIGMLKQYENASIFDAGQDPLPFEDFFPDSSGPAEKVVNYFERQLPAEVRENFSLRDMSFSSDFHKMGITVRGVMGGNINKLADVIGRFDVDVLLVSGRPSRLPAIRDLLLRIVPVTPSKILFMHEYQVGSWYPFASSRYTIDDPKTTVVMGALVCSLAESARLPLFSIVSGAFKLPTTARFIGHMNADNTLSDENILFTMDKGQYETESRPMLFHGPVRIGFRQLPNPNWPATQLYWLELAVDNENRNRMIKSLPWRVIFSRDEKEEDTSEDAIYTRKKKEHDESFKIEEILNRLGDKIPNSRLSLRLQTLDNIEGYWLDTGQIKLD